MTNIKMKLRLIFLLLILTFITSYGQKQGSVWYFGDHAGLDFNTGNPIAITNGATYDVGSDGSEGTAVISDSSGSLLFYTNGQNIWNKNHQIMPNGDSLLGNVSSTQAALIVAQPGSSRYFYVFTTDDFYNDQLKYGFRYSIVDICLDNGFGDVIISQKNIKLLDTVAEKLTAVRHANGIDYWVITHKYFSDAFYSYHLSSSGIVDTVISHVGSIHPTGMIGLGGAIGQLKASPNGQKLAIVNAQSAPNIAEYFNFDKNTGIVSNCVSVQTNQYYGYYGVSFSPDNSKLYIACCLNANGIYQFDLNAGNGNSDSVRASKTLIVGYWNSFGIQLANNGKIYVVRSGNSGKYLSVINNPNNLGLNCNYIDSAIYLGGKTSFYNLPNFIDSYDYSNTSYNCQTGIYDLNSKKLSIKIYPNPAQGAFTIELPEKETFSLLVSDIMGRKIYERKNATGIVKVDCSGFSSSVYFVKATNEENILTSKFIKE